MPPPGVTVKPTQQIDTSRLPPVGGSAQTRQDEVVISTALDAEMKIKKNYTKGSGAGATSAVGTQKCPKCQQEIPLSEWKEHMKLELMDPKWREEKLKRQEREKLHSMADGDEIAQNVKRFAQERRDLFGGLSYGAPGATASTN